MEVFFVAAAFLGGAVMGYLLATHIHSVAASTPSPAVVPVVPAPTPIPAPVPGATSSAVTK
jgi:hypothetical protein